MQASNLPQPQSHRPDVVERRVLGQPGLVRIGQAVVNKDTSAYLAAVARKEAAARQAERLDRMEGAIDALTESNQKLMEMMKCLLQAAKTS